MIPNQAIVNNFSNNEPQWFLNMIVDYKGFKMIKHSFLWPRLTHSQTYDQNLKDFKSKSRMKQNFWLKNNWFLNDDMDDSYGG